MESNNLPSCRDAGSPSTTPERLEILKQKDEHQYTYALEVLKAKERDRVEERKFIQQMHNKSNRTWLWRLFMICAFLLIALYMGKEKFLTDALQYLAVLLGGGGIGYVYGYRKGQRKRE